MAYHPLTLRTDNVERLSFLPCYPSSFDEQQEALLFANVPVKWLSSAQLRRRQAGTFQRQFNYVGKKDRTNIPSFMKFIYRNFILSLSQRLKVDESIIDFNLTRLDEITAQTIRQRTDHSESGFGRTYHMHEWPVALEIFLQIDGKMDTCFMKTCSFRGAHPRWMDETNPNSIEGLFCIDPPETRYLMLPCTNSSCFCCYQPLDISCRRAPSVRFALEQPHRFVNGYQIYLNAHTTCRTTHFLYVLTCPCGQLDFIGSSHHPDQSFKDVLLNHRRESIRILHEFLLGEKIIQRTFDMYERQKTNEEKKADQQYLYRHLTECSAAFQLLLNCSAHYWCFVPMVTVEADEEDRLFRLKNSNQTQSVPQDDSEDWSPRERTDQETEWCLAHVPRPPDGTRFSRLQLLKQKAFLKQGRDLLFLPPRHLDLLDMAPLFVLPEQSSQLLCQVIEFLFITHAECRLNTTGHLSVDRRPLCELKNPSWYKNLVGRQYK